MFNSISWQDFLTAIMIVVGGYYAITTLLLYSTEITSIFKQKQPKQITSEVAEDQKDSIESNDLMGKVKYETEVQVPREKSISVEELQVLSSDEHEEAVTTSSANHSDTLIIGTIADLLQEIKALAGVVKDSSKEEAVPLFKSLLSRYPQLAGTNYREAVSVFLYDSCKQQCEFDLEPNEINSWWPTTGNTSSESQ
jgi:hypothetical protein